MVGRRRTTQCDVTGSGHRRYCGGAEVLEPAPYIRGCVRANHPISTSQEFLTTACWSFQSARSVVSRLCGSFRLSAVFRWWWIHPLKRGVNGRASGPLHYKIRINNFIVTNPHLLYFYTDFTILEAIFQFALFGHRSYGLINLRW